MRVFYTILAVLLIGATVFTFMLKEDTKPTAPAAQTAGLNPPHGQPGHKCELPVGAPLNGTPAAASTTEPAQGNRQDSAVNRVTVPVPAGAAAPKTNPAHGLPGHRCDLAVGAPL